MIREILEKEDAEEISNARIASVLEANEKNNCVVECNDGKAHVLVQEEEVI